MTGGSNLSSSKSKRFSFGTPWISLVAAALSVATTGCANLKRAEQASGLGDAVLLFIGKASPNVAPIDILPSNAAQIYGVRAVPEQKGILVYGSIGRPGFENVSTRYWYIQVTIIDVHGKIAETISTDFFPTPVPYSSSRDIERSHFFVRFERIPATGSRIQVALNHKEP